MKCSLNTIAMFFVTEEAAAATEYAIMLCLIVLVAVGAISGLGQKTKVFFRYLSGSLPA